jgi:hypothetical protein
MKPIAAAVAGAVISGVAMYTVGAKTAQVDAFTSNPGVQNPGLVQTLDGQYLSAPTAGVQPVRYTTVTPAPRATVTPIAARRTVSSSRNVAAPSAQRDRVVDDERQPTRTWKKTALIIGGSTASGAGVGAIIGGKKGAIAGAAIGGGAASIYEATRRR